MYIFEEEDHLEHEFDASLDDCEVFALNHFLGTGGDGDPELETDGHLGRLKDLSQDVGYHVYIDTE